MQKKLTNRSRQRESKIFDQFKMSGRNVVQFFPRYMEEMSHTLFQSKIKTFAVGHDDNQASACLQDTVQFNYNRAKQILCKMLKHIVRYDMSEFSITKGEPLGDIGEFDVKAEAREVVNAFRVAVDSPCQRINVEIKTVSAAKVENFRTSGKIQEWAFKETNTNKISECIRTHHHRMIRKMARRVFGTQSHGFHTP